MFNIFKRKNKEPNKVFGKVKKFDFWWSTSINVNLELWGKTYILPCYVFFDIDKENPYITQEQEDIYCRFEEERIEIQQKVEKIVEDYYGTTDSTVLLEKYKPYQLMITPNAECAIIASNSDDEDFHDVLPGLAVVVYPKMSIFTKEEYSEYVFHDGERWIKKELYDE